MEKKKGNGRLLNESVGSLEVSANSSHQLACICGSLVRSPVSYRRCAVSGQCFCVRLRGCVEQSRVAGVSSRALSSDVSTRLCKGLCYGTGHTIKNANAASSGTSGRLLVGPDIACNGRSNACLARFCVVVHGEAKSSIFRAVWSFFLSAH